MTEIYQEISPIVNKKAFGEFKDLFIEIGEEEVSENHSTHKRVNLKLNEEHSIQVELSVGKITKNEDEVFITVQIVENAITSNLADNALFVMYFNEILKIKDVIDAINEEVSLKLKQQTGIELRCHFEEKVDNIKNMTEEEKDSVVSKYQAIF